MNRALENPKTKLIRRPLLVGMLTLAIICILAIVFDFYYDLNDDTTMKDIISGAYTGTPSGYSIFMLYPLGVLLGACYRVFPGIAWYGVFSCMCYFGVFFLVGMRLAKITDTKRKQIVALYLEIILFIGLLLRELVMVQFSMTSAICMGGAIFLYMTSRESGSCLSFLRENAGAIILLTFSFMIRTDMCMMLLPFLCLAGLSRIVSQLWIEHKNAKEVIFKNSIVIASAMIIMGMTYFIDIISVQPQNWQEFQRFNEARPKLYDYYDIPEYQGNESFYQSIGLPEESYTLLQNYNFALDEQINANMLEEIVSYEEKTGNLYSFFGLFFTKKNVSEGIWVYKDRVLHLRGGVWSIVILSMYLLLGGCLWGLCRKKKILMVLQTLFLFGGRSVLWIYLCMLDRVLDRVAIPLYMAEFLLLLMWIYQTVRDNKKEKYQVVICIFLFLIGTAGITYNGKRTLEEYQKREEINPRWEVFLEYCKEHQDNFYVMDLYSSTSYEGVPFSEKIFEENGSQLKNYEICGGWLVKSPLFKEKLSIFGIDTIEHALLQEGTFFVIRPDKNLEWLCAYYAQKGKEIQMELVDSIFYDEDIIYKIYRLQEM